MECSKEMERILISYWEFRFGFAVEITLIFIAVIIHICNFEWLLKYGNTFNNEQVITWFTIFHI